MDKIRKLELIQRSLGLRHKLKVHESMKMPDTHEDIAIMLITKWEFEDELRAIEEILGDSRTQNAASKKAHILREGPKLPSDKDANGVDIPKKKSASKKALTQ